MWKVVKQVPARPLILIGAGNLGTTLAANYNDFEGRGLKIVAAFDHDPKRCGTPIGNIKSVDHVSDIHRVTKQHGAKIAILAVQGDNAQEITKMCVDAGISTILSYSPVSLVVPNHVHVEYMDPALKLQMSLTQSGQTLTYGVGGGGGGGGYRSCAHTPPFGLPISPFPAHISQYMSPLLTPVSKYYRVTSTGSRNFYSTMRSRAYTTCAGNAPMYSSFPQYSNRYAGDFDEMGVLGRGGFGSVFQARNRMDGVDYAVKKVTINVTPLSFATIADHKYLREVRAMARLNHPNLVRYYYAWMEYGEQNVSNQPTDNSYSSSSGRMSVSAADGDEDTCENDDTTASCVGVEAEEGAVDGAHETIRLILYIQMEFCAGMTLKDWMARADRTVNTKLCQDILVQIVQGLRHIHSHGFIHRDVTPPNIFLEQFPREIVVKIGDFGLAKHCSDLSTDYDNIKTTKGFDKTLGGVGTYLYASPEQLSGVLYDTSADMYSVGVIFFELLHPFGTQMERGIHLTQLKSGHVPMQFATRYPNESKIIEDLLSEVPSRRPSADAILARVKL